MKKRFYLIYTVILALLVFAGCQDRTDLTAPTINPKSGNADLTRFVVIGNSLAAGYQSGSLYASAQQYSFGNQIAKQVGTTYEMPLISDPGTGGRIEIKQLFPLPPVLSFNTNQGQPTNLNYPLPYNDLGVPGALLYDVMNATSSTTCASYLYSNRPNPLFDVILRGHGTQFAQAKALHPTFVILWIGNNDVLGFATSGGAAPTAPTPTPTFQYLYSQLADSIASLGAQVVVANIPEVTAIPYFTTVGPVMATEIPWDLLRFLHVPGLMYQKHGEVVGTGFADSTSLATGTVLITLQGSNYATLIGDTTGAFDKAYYGSNIPAGIDTHQPFGFSPFNPWPDGLILDPSEITTAQNSTAEFNATIASLASAKGFGLVDINSFFNQIRQNDFTGGTVFNNIRFTTEYILGGLFSLDGVHPTSQGYGIVANQFIKVIDSKFGGNIPLIDIGTIPGSLILDKKSMYTGKDLPYFEPGTFNHLLF